MEAMLFDRNHPKYRCCLDCCHVRFAAVCVGAVELVLVLYELISKLVVLANTLMAQRPYELYTNLLLVDILCCLLMFVCIVLLFLGVAKTLPQLLIPHLLAQCLCLLALALLVTFAFAPTPARHFYWYFLSSNTTLAEVRPGVNETRPAPLPADSQISSLMVGSLVFYLVEIVLSVWFILLVFRCYRYLHEKYLHERLIGIPLQR